MARILVIDDEEGLRVSLARALASENHEVVLAADGAEGMEKHRAQPADLVVVDLYMDKQDGFETIQVLRKDFPRVPIIVISGGHLSEEVLTMASQMGANRILLKPFDANVFLNSVRQLL